MNFLFATAPDDGPGDLTEAEQAGLARSNIYFSEGAGYMQIQSTKPQTLAYGLTDSAIGQLAWIAEKFLAWTDNDGTIESAVSRDRLLTNISLYWFTATAGSSARMYYEVMHSGAAGLTDRLDTPIGVANFPMEILQAPRHWMEDRYNIVHWSDMAEGGHFAAMEEPEALARDIAAFFRRFRRGPPRPGARSPETVRVPSLPPGPAGWAARRAGRLSRLTGRGGGTTLPGLVLNRLRPRVHRGDGPGAARRRGAHLGYQRQDHHRPPGSGRPGCLGVPRGGQHRWGQSGARGGHRLARRSRRPTGPVRGGRSRPAGIDGQGPAPVRHLDEPVSGTNWTATASWSIWPAAGGTRWPRSSPVPP